MKPIATFPDKTKDSDRVLLFGFNALNKRDAIGGLGGCEWHIGYWWADEQCFKADSDGYVVIVSTLDAVTTSTLI